MPVLDIHQGEPVLLVKLLLFALALQVVRGVARSYQRNPNLLIRLLTDDFALVRSRVTTSGSSADSVAQDPIARATSRMAPAISMRARLRALYHALILWRSELRRPRGFGGSHSVCFGMGIKFLSAEVGATAEEEAEERGTT